MSAHPRWVVARLLGAVLFAWLALAASAVAAAPSFPALTGRVVDEAGILAAPTKARLEQMLARQERTSGDQVVVVTSKSLQGYAIEDYGYRLGRYWQIGVKGKDNGTLLLVAPKERAVRIEVGYGLEGKLTDAQSKLIIENVILPAFKKGSYDKGVLEGTAILLRVLGGDASAIPQGDEPADDGDNTLGAGAVVAFIVIWFLFGRFLWPFFLLGGRGGRHGGRGGFSGRGGSFGGGGASGRW